VRGGDLKKGRNDVSTLFSAFDVAPIGGASISKAPALAVLYRLGLLDGRFVIPGAANGNLAHARRSKVGHGLGLLVATTPES
jgi:hypothetical protein